MTEDTIFAIASMTKPITCVGVMRLVEQGKIDLDDPIAKYLPELSNLRVLGDPRQRHRLGDRHRAGPAGCDHSRPAGAPLRDLVRRLLDQQRPPGARATPGPRCRARGLKTIAEQVSRLAKAPLAHQPGEGWTYGLSHDVLGRLIEVVSGQQFDAYLHEHIFVPLDMKDTFFLVPRGEAGQNGHDLPGQ